MAQEAKTLTRSVVMGRANRRLAKSGRALRYFPPSRFQIVDLEAETPIGPILSPVILENWARKNGIVEPSEKMALSKW